MKIKSPWIRFFIKVLLAGLIIKISLSPVFGSDSILGGSATLFGWLGVFFIFYSLTEVFQETNTKR